MPQPRHTETSILQSYLLPPSPLPTILPYSSFLQLVPAQHRTHPNLKRLYRDLQFQRNVDVNTVRENIDREVARGASLKANLARQIADEQGLRRARSKPDGETDTMSRKRKRISTGAPDDEGENEAAAQSLDDSGETQNVNPNGNPDEFTNPVDTALDTTYYTSSLHPSHPHSASQSHPLTSGASRLSGLGKYHTAASLVSSMNTAILDIDSEITDLESESDRLLDEMNEIVGSLSDLRYGKFAKAANSAGINGHGEASLENEIIEALNGLEKAIGKVV